MTRAMFAPHPFSLRQLQYVVALADLLSFRKAAEHCHVSQPALSSQLAQLEDAIGVRLFERDQRGVVPTASGTEIVSYARHALRVADELVESARRAEDPFASTMRLGIIPTISPYLLPHVVPAVREAYPKLTIRWTEDKTVDLMAGVRSHTLDAAIVALEADLGEVEHAVVSRDAFVLATPIGHDLARRRAMRFSELRDVGVLLLGDGHCLRDQTQVLCANAKARELEFRATSLSTLVQMVASGAGVTLLPSLAVAIEAARARLHIRPLSNPTPHRTIVLAWNRNSVAAAMQRLAATLRRAYPDARRRM